MSDLNHIELPPSVIAELYRASIVPSGSVVTKVQPISTEKDKKAETPGDITPDEHGWIWLGGNKKNILMILHHDQGGPQKDVDLDFLKGILKACNLVLDDITLMNIMDHPDATATELTKHFKSKVVLLFGYAPERFGLPMSFPLFQIQPFSGCSYLYSPSLDELQKDKVLKSKLWVSLRRLFNI